MVTRAIPPAERTNEQGAMGLHADQDLEHSEDPEDPSYFTKMVKRKILQMDTSNDLKLDDPLSAFFSKGVPIVNLFLVLSFIGKMKYHDLTIASPLSIFYLTCLVLTCFIHVAMIEWWWNWQEKWQCMIAYLSTMLRMSAATAVVLFLDTGYLVVVLPLSLLVVALGTYFFWQTFCIGVKPGINWKDHKEELKLQFDISAQVVSMAFGGLSGKVLGYAKASDRTSEYTAVAVALEPEWFLFYGVVLGLLVVLFCTVPTRISHRTTRRKMAKVYIPMTSFTALIFLDLAGIIAAAENLEEYVFFLCFFIIVIAVLFSWWKNQNSQVLPTRNEEAVARSENASREQDSKLYQYIATAYFTPLFAAVMAAQSKYRIESGSAASLSWMFKGFVLSAVCSILSHAIRIVVSTWTPGTRSREFSTTEAWTYATNVTMASTVIFAFLLMFMRLDEVENIF